HFFVITVGLIKLPSNSFGICLTDFSLLQVSEEILGKDFNTKHRHQVMETAQPIGTASQVYDQPDASLDLLLNLKSRILRSKLEVLASEIYTRLNLADRNLGRIDDEKARVQEMIVKLNSLA